MSEIQVDKLQRVLSGIVDRLPASPSEGDTASLRQDIDTLTESDENSPTVDPATATAGNPLGVVPDENGGSNVTPAPVDVPTPVDVPAPVSREAEIEDVDSFLANASDEDVAKIEEYIKNLRASEAAS